MTLTRLSHSKAAYASRVELSTCLHLSLRLVYSCLKRAFYTNMSSAPPPNPPPSGNNNGKSPAPPASSDSAPAPEAAMDTTPDVPEEETWADIPEEILQLSTDDIIQRTRLIDNDMKVIRSETTRLQHEQSVMKEKIRENGEKVKQNKVLPYLVGNVVEVFLFSESRCTTCILINCQIDSGCCTRR